MNQYYSEEEFIKLMDTYQFDYNDVVVIKDDAGFCYSAFSPGASDDSYVPLRPGVGTGKNIVDALNNSDIGVILLTNSGTEIRAFYGRMGLMPTQTTVDRLARRAEGKKSNDEDRLKKFAKDRNMRKGLTHKFMLDKIANAPAGSVYELPESIPGQNYDENKLLPFKMEFFQPLTQRGVDFYRYVSENTIALACNSKFEVGKESIKVYSDSGKLSGEFFFNGQHANAGDAINEDTVSALASIAMTSVVKESRIFT